MIARRGHLPGKAVLGALCLLLGAATRAAAPLPAFPGAEGFGAHTPGGRGGRIIEVTNLSSDGPGSLREACAAKGPRIVVFRVGGIIEGSVSVREPFITIAGQTAPGDGICIRNGVFHVGTHDVIVRHLRVRPGDHPFGPCASDRDCISVSGPGDRVHDVIIDHCSVSWGIDENMGTWGRPRNVTFQWCITSESLLDMAGNALEWVHDWSHSSYYQTSRTDPQGPTTGTLRSLCGGHFRWRAWHVMRYVTTRHRPHYRGAGVGFRLCRTLP